MVVAPFRELQTHQQQLPSVFSSLLARNSGLRAVVSGGRLDETLDIVLSTSYSSIGTRIPDFKTRLDGVIAQYAERWIKVEPELFRLRHSYMNLFSVVDANSDPDALLFVHTEPGESDPILTDPSAIRHRRWKVGPHMHVKAAKSGIGKCHFHLGVLGRPLTTNISCGKFRRSLQSCLEMLTDELAEYLDIAS